MRNPFKTLFLMEELIDFMHMHDLGAVSKARALYLYF